MRRAELDSILTTMLGMDRQTETALIRRTKEVSDLNFTVDRAPQVEQNGELVPVLCNPPLERLTPYQTEMIALNLIGGNPRLTEELIRTGSCDSSYSVGVLLRFRVNIFSQRGRFSIVMRKLNTDIPTLEQLRMPEIFLKLPMEKTGLILVTGATGSGKTTTLAAVLDKINTTKSVHVITLEDPVEFLHPSKKSTFNQREMGNDFSTFAAGLRAALRQAPKVVLVGEMRDRETVEIGLSAAETGHLVLSTLHTIDAGQTINRILGMFEPDEQEQIRVRLSDTLRWVVSQRLAPRIGGGRYALLEIMGANLRTKETIVHGESEGKSFYEIIESNHTFGWRNFDQACLEAYEQNIITEESALSYASKRGYVSRGIDVIKKARGEAISSGDLKMKREVRAAPAFPRHLETKIIEPWKNLSLLGPNDRPALVAMTTPEALSLVKTILLEMGYKVHVVENPAQFETRYNQVNYQVVIIEEDFAGGNLADNPTLHYVQTMSMGQRRGAAFFLIGQTSESLNAMQAFAQSVHCVLHFNELPVLADVIHKTLAENDVFMATFRDVQRRMLQKAV